MDDILLSIIVPVYKTGKTLYRCLDSLFGQLQGQENKVEILAVNDASPDDCGELLLAYQRAHPKLTIITHEKNLGEAGTHNTGIAQSHGCYYTFVDSDDTLRPGAIARLLKIIREHQPDLIHYTYARVDENGHFISKSTHSVEGFYPVDTTDTKASAAIFNETAFGIMTSGGVYRRGVADELKMDPQFPISGERYYGWQFFSKCKTVYLLDEVLYDYYQYGNTISKKFSEKAVRGLLELNILYWQEAQQYPFFETVGKYMLRKLLPAQVGWDRELVFESEPEKRALSDLYFRALKGFLDRRVAIRDLGMGWWYLNLAEKLRSPFLVALYSKFVVGGTWRIKRKLRRMLKI